MGILPVLADISETGETSKYFKALQSSTSFADGLAYRYEHGYLFLQVTRSVFVGLQAIQGVKDNVSSTYTALICEVGSGLMCFDIALGTTQWGRGPAFVSFKLAPMIGYQSRPTKASLDTSMDPVEE